MHEHSQGESVISVVDECGDALYGVMAYAKRWHMDARLADCESMGISMESTLDVREC